MLLICFNEIEWVDNFYPFSIGALQMLDAVINEAYTQAVNTDNNICNAHSFKAGYLALLNQLNQTGSLVTGSMSAKHGEMHTLIDEHDDQCGYWKNRGYELVPVYSLPEGIMK